MTAPSPDSELLDDPLLRVLPTLEGHKVLGSVVLLQKLGEGGMGIVYRGHHCVLDVPCAVKFLRPSLAAEDPSFAKRLRAEARVAATLSHQNVVRLFDAGEQAGLHFLVMEYVAGESVQRRVQRRGPQSEAEALAILHGASCGLAEAHARSMVHRDVKPDNLLLTPAGRVKVVDLGIVKPLVDARTNESQPSLVMGTPQYMAPEQWEGPVFHATDVWALGAVAWFLLTGEHAFAATSLATQMRRVVSAPFPSLRERLPGVRPEVHAVLERCVAREPGARFPDAGALRDALAELTTIGEAGLADPGHTFAEDAPDAATATTIERVRAALATTKASAAGGFDHEGRTVVSRGGTVPMPPPSRGPWRGRVVAALAALLLLGGSGAWYGADAGWFDDAAAWAEAERLVAAKGLFAEAERLLPQAGQLPAAITKLRELHELAPEHARGRALLAAALDKHSQQLAANDLDAAVVAGQESLELDPTNTLAAERLEALRGRLRGRMLVGLSIDEPQLGAVMPQRTFVVRGRVPTAVRDVAVVLETRGDGTPVRFPARIVAGEFEVQVAAPDAGRWWVGLDATDRHGVSQHAVPTQVLVAGVVGAGTTRGAPDPAAARPPRLVTVAGVTMVPLAAHAFAMGSPPDEAGRDEDEPQHEVVLTEPFWLAETEVTRAQWARVMETDPWRGEPATPSLDPPATSMSWPLAVEFCERLTAAERDAGRVPDGYRYCLPSEAQWELAARGGRDGAPVPDGELAQHAVIDAERFRPADVRTKQPNDVGIHDLLGNVEEWCADHASGTTRVTTLTTGFGGEREPLSTLGPHRIVRGGSFASPASDCRPAARSALPPDTATPRLGFRPALAKR